ncbi:ABC transporter ATP-binding protein [Streptomyces adustus]|uniref:ABC transporter ATP-binding protein n=1 Tax=Streptomyces adustus TaxID=1609272 RepID=A0A5N8V800_9ACTN|nr:ABC transporter ATP-binding protein [Streptomyces adustus]MPY31016.1 ABC transporter ATP-binding protein [Streptomyces adustus]
MDTLLAVRARGITRYFGDVVALDGVDLDVAQGQIHGLVGPNGAGKTTLLGLLLGLAVADSGRLEVLGTPVGRALAVPDGVAGFVDGPGLYPALTARQNLAALAALRGRTARTAGIDDVLDQVGLTDVADDRARGFSLGMRQRLGLAAALLTRPRLLVLDEPSNGLDPAGKRHVHRVLTRLAADGTGIVLSSHRMDDVEALCSDVTLLATGRVVFSGPLGKLAAESRELDYRLLTSDPRAARALALSTPGIAVVDDGGTPTAAAARHNAPAPPGIVPAQHGTPTPPPTVPAQHGTPTSSPTVPPQHGAPTPHTVPAQRGGTARYGAEAFVVSALVPALDVLVARIVRAGIAVRELAPVVSPLEAAFLALTEQQEADR